MGIIITIIVGGLIGWLAGLIMGTEWEQGLFWNIIIGIVGSFLGAWLFGSVFGVGTAFLSGTFSIWGLFWGILGAVVLIAILRALRILR